MNNANKKPMLFHRSLEDRKQPCGLFSVLQYYSYYSNIVVAKVIYVTTSNFSKIKSNVSKRLSAKKIHLCTSGRKFNTSRELHRPIAVMFQYVIQIFRVRREIHLLQKVTFFVAFLIQVIITSYFEQHL